MPLRHDLSDRRFLGQPPGGPFHERHLRRGARLDVGEHRARDGKVDGHVVAGEQSRRIGGMARRENRADLVARRGRMRLERMGHPAVAEQRELHAAAFSRSRVCARRTYASVPALSSASAIRS